MAQPVNPTLFTSEEALIALLLADIDSASELFNRYAGSDFADARCGAIYELIFEFYSQGEEEIDVYLIANHFEALGMLTWIGGLFGLHRLTVVGGYLTGRGASVDLYSKILSKDPADQAVRKALTVLDEATIRMQQRAAEATN